MHILYSILFVVGFFAIGAWAIIGLSRESEKFYDALEQIEKKAQAATTLDALYVIHHEFVVFANKNAVLRAYGAEARKVDLYIKGKIEGLKVGGAKK